MKAELQTCIFCPKQFFSEEKMKTHVLFVHGKLTPQCSTKVDEALYNYRILILKLWRQKWKQFVIRLNNKEVIRFVSGHKKSDEDFFTELTRATIDLNIQNHPRITLRTLEKIDYEFGFYSSLSQNLRTLLLRKRVWNNS